MAVMRTLLVSTRQDYATLSAAKIATQATGAPYQVPESTVGQPGGRLSTGNIYVEYSVKYSKCRALNGGILVSTVDC